MGRPLRIPASRAWKAAPKPAALDRRRPRKEIPAVCVRDTSCVLAKSSAWCSSLSTLKISAETGSISAEGPSNSASRGPRQRKYFNGTSSFGLRSATIAQSAWRRRFCKSYRCPCRLFGGHFDADLQGEEIACRAGEGSDERRGLRRFARDCDADQ